MRGVILLLGIAPLTVHCGGEDWRNADLQLDILDADLGEHPDEVRVRLCVDGVGNHEEALGAGSVAFLGLPPDADAAITVDALSDSLDETRVGRAGPITLGDDQPWAETTWSPCEDEDCTACQSSGDRVAEGDPDWLLAVRFR